MRGGKTPEGCPRRHPSSYSRTACSPQGEDLALWYIPGTGDILGLTGAEQLGGYVISEALRADFRSGRHFHGVNIAYADGHVKWLKTEQVIQEARKPAPTQYGAWNPANP